MQKLIWFLDRFSLLPRDGMLVRLYGTHGWRWPFNYTRHATERICETSGRGRFELIWKFNEYSPDLFNYEHHGWCHSVPSLIVPPQICWKGLCSVGYPSLVRNFLIKVKWNYRRAGILGEKKIYYSFRKFYLGNQNSCQSLVCADLWTRHHGHRHRLGRIPEAFRSIWFSLHRRVPEFGRNRLSPPPLLSLGDYRLCQGSDRHARTLNWNNSLNELHYTPFPPESCSRNPSPLFKYNYRLLSNIREVKRVFTSLDVNSSEGNRLRLF